MAVVTLRSSEQSMSHREVGLTSGYPDEPVERQTALAHRLSSRVAIVDHSADFAPERVEIDVRPTMMALVVVTSGRAEVASHSYRGAIHHDRAVLLAAPGKATIVWSAGSKGFVAQASRSAVQALASAGFGLPVRIAPVAKDLVAVRGEANVGRMIADVWRTRAPSDASSSARVCGVIAELVLAQSDRDDLLLVSQSVRRAVKHIVANPESDCDDAMLATVTGVTARTLRDGFRACLGMPLSAFIQQTRLNHARDSLASGRDSRPMLAIARAAGFQSGSAFTRAYLKLFFENPAMTRAICARS